MDIANEAHLYTEMLRSNITFVSVGHRPTLVPFHQDVLRLSPADDTPGAWSIVPAQSLLPEGSMSETGVLL
jgi:putative ATP-binding cassette transporter